MRIHEPFFFLPTAALCMAASAIYLALGIRFVRKITVSSWWMVPFYLSMAVVFATFGIGEVLRSLDAHHPSARTLFALGFAGGSLVVTLVSAGANRWVGSRLHHEQEQAERLGPLPQTRPTAP